MLDSILDAVGRTPLVRLQRVTRGLRPTMLAKLEMLNLGKRQGPDRAADDRGGRARRPPQAGGNDRGAHQRQHGARAGDRGRPQGVQVHLRHARQDEPGEDRPAQGLRRRGGHHAHGRAAGAWESPTIGSPIAWRRRSPARSSPISTSTTRTTCPRGPPARDLGADRRADRRPGGERRHGRNHHGRRSVSGTSKPLAGRRRGGPGGIAVLGRRAAPLSHRGHRRGFLAGRSTRT